MVDYRRRRREMLALAGTQGILLRETNRKRSHDSFDFPLVPKYRRALWRACLNIYDFPQAHWSRAV